MSLIAGKGRLIMANGGLLAQIASGGNIAQDVSQGYLSGLQFKQQQELGQQKLQLGELNLQKEQMAIDAAQQNSRMEAIKNLRQEDIDSAEWGIQQISPVLDYFESTGDIVGANQQLGRITQEAQRLGYNMEGIPPEISPDTLPIWKTQRQQAIMTVDEYRKLATQGTASKLQFKGIATLPDGTEVPSAFNPAGEYLVRRGDQWVKAPPGTLPKEKEGVSVTVEAGEKKAQEERAKELSDVAASINEDAKTATTSVRNLTVARNILDRQVETGAFQDLITNVQGMFKQAGVDLPGMNNVSDMETLRTMLEKQQIGMLSQMDKPSDKDAEMVKRASARITNDEDAIKFLVNSELAVAQRAIEKHQFKEDYWAKNNSYEGMLREWDKYLDKTPLVGKRKDGKVSFWHDFKRAYKQNKPDASLETIIKDWRTLYGE